MCAGKLPGGGRDRPRNSYLFKTREGATGLLQFTLINTATSATFRHKRLLTSDQLAAWSKPAKGLRLRLRPLKRQWPTGETPELRLDLWNVGTEDFACLCLQQQCEIEVDGRWYRWGGVFVTNGLSQLIRPGRCLEDAVTITLGTDWARADQPIISKPTGAQRLHLKPGPHTVRVALKRADFPADEQDRRLVSRPVKVVVEETDRRDDFGAAQVKKPAPKATPPRGKDQSRRSIPAQVVDAQTGRPVEHFTVEDRSPSAGMVRWGSGVSTGTSRDGHFDIRPFRAYEGDKVAEENRGECRIIAPGYLPAHVRVPDGHPADEVLLVKLARGETVRGRVLDHQGKPVAGAGVYLAGPSRPSFGEGLLGFFGSSEQATVHTNNDGRFEITGRGPQTEAVIVSAPGLLVWRVDVPNPGEEATIRLPEPRVFAFATTFRAAHPPRTCTSFFARPA